MGKGWSRGRLLGNKMIWFLMAALILPGTNIVSFKINQFSQFNTEQECVDYLKTYDKYVKAGLRLKFPNMEIAEIRCVDIDTAIKMQKHMQRGNEASK